MAALSEDSLINFLYKYSAPWFSENSNPVLIAYLAGFANVASFLYSCLLYCKVQTRPETSTDIFLDLYAEDFFGDLLIRCDGQSDADFLIRIQKMMLAPRVTRQAMIDRLTDLTGRVPIIYENFNDAGYYNHAFLGHTFAGGDGAYQAWITAYRPTPTVTNTSSFANQTAFATAESFYGTGEAQNACVTDEDTLNTIEITKAAGTLMHVTILD